MDAIKLESSPPDKSTPYGTSDIIRLRTALMRASRSDSKFTGGVGREAEFRHAGLS